MTDQSEPTRASVAPPYRWHLAPAEWRDYVEALEGEIELLRGALLVVIDEIEGGDLQYATAFARKALERPVEIGQ